jgi:hypothetical protein
MYECRVCGRGFDPLGFQVVVPGLSEGFDRMVCARQARAAGVAAGAAATTAPLAELTRPLAAPAPPVAVAAGAAVAVVAGDAAATVRTSLLVGANVGLLAAGAAATAFLWLRVLGVDPSTAPLPSAVAAPAFGRETVPALIESETRPSRERREVAAAEPTRARTATETPRTPSAPTRSGGSSDAVLVEATQPARGGGTGDGGRRAGGDRDGDGGAPSVAPKPARTAPATRPAPSTDAPGRSGGHRRGKAKGAEQRGKPASSGGPGGHGNAHSKGKGKKVGHGKHH